LRDFSIVVPTYSRPDSLEQLLGALTALEYPPNRFEVVVVDDGGEIPLEPRLEEYRDPLNLLLLRQPNAGPGAARNHGARHAKGEYLAFTDDDCLPDPGWLRAMEAALQSSGCAICGGKTRNEIEGNLYSEATQLLADYLNEHYNPTRTLGAFFPTNNLSISRKAFAALGGFDGSLRLGEDRDLCYRWAARGHDFVYAPDAVVYHAHRLTLSSFLRLHFMYGGGHLPIPGRLPQEGPLSSGPQPGPVVCEPRAIRVPGTEGMARGHPQRLADGDSRSDAGGNGLQFPPSPSNGRGSGKGRATRARLTVRGDTKETHGHAEEQAGPVARPSQPGHGVHRTHVGCSRHDSAL